MRRQCDEQLLDSNNPVGIPHVSHAPRGDVAPRVRTLIEKRPRSNCMLSFAKTEPAFVDDSSRPFSDARGAFNRIALNVMSARAERAID